MAIQDRKEREKRELREKVFDAAGRIILEQGYEKLTMRRIAEEIEYSPTILYHYFKDKADIVNQITLEVYRNCVDNIKDELERNNGHDAREQLKIALMAFVRSMTANSEQFKAIMLSGGDMTIPDPDTSRESAISIVEHLLEKGVKEQVLNDVTAVTVQILVSAVFGLIFHIVGHGIQDSIIIDEMANELAEILLSGLTKQID